MKNTAGVALLLQRSTESTMTRRTIVVCAVLWLSLLNRCSTAPNTFQNPSREAVRFGDTGRALTYVVMGDSTAAGEGAPYSQGIAVGTATALAADHRVTMTNLGVSGARIKDVVNDQLAASIRLHPDLVLLSVAANDVTHLTSVGAMESSLRSIVHALKTANPNMAIIVTGSPDMGSPPRIPRLLRGLASRRTEAINRMFRKVAAEEQLTFAPIADATGPLFRKDRSLFADDRFHPNARGYATWIRVLNEAIARALIER
jgi:lysophospholipase L1-like esterase